MVLACDLAVLSLCRGVAVVGSVVVMVVVLDWEGVTLRKWRVCKWRLEWLLLGCWRWRDGNGGKDA